MVQNGQTSLRDFSNGHLKLSLSSWDLMSLYPSSSMAFPQWVWIKEMLENDILSLQAKAVAEEFRDVPYVSRSKLSLCREPRVWVWRYWEIESVHGRDKKLRSRLVSSWGSRLRSSYLIKVIFPGWSFCNFLADSISSAMSWHVLLGQGFGIFNHIWEKAGLTEQCTQSSTVARCIWDLSHLRKPRLVLPRTGAVVPRAPGGHEVRLPAVEDSPGVADQEDHLQVHVGIIEQRN